MQAKMLYMRKTPGESAAILYLLTAGFVLFPTQWMGELFTKNHMLSQMLGLGLVRILFAAVMIVLALEMGIRHVFFVQKGEWKALLFAIPALVVAVNNLPIIALANGSAFLTGNGLSFFAFAIECIGVGLFEETAFRGVIFPFVLGKTGTGKKGRFIAVIVSSAMFGCLHLVNLLGGFSGGVFLQVGYSFLIGSMLAICMFRGAGVLTCAFIHATFNFCGNIISNVRGLGFGAFSDVWCWQEILLTAVVGVAAIVYFVWLLYTSNPDVAEKFAVYPPKKKKPENFGTLTDTVPDHNADTSAENVCKTSDGQSDGSKKERNIEKADDGQQNQIK